MPKTSDIVLGGNITAIFKGKTGTRKTCAAATFPGPIYFFDFDGRMDPVKKMYPDRTDIEYDTYFPTDFKKVNTKWDRLMEGRDKYRTVVFDSMTTFADCALEFARVNRSGGKQMIEGILPMSDISDYNIETSALTQLMYKLKMLSKSQNCHVILIAHVLEVNSTDIITKQNTVSRTLLTAGKKIAEKFPAVFNEVYHFETESPSPNMPPKVIVRTDNSGIDFAKTALHLPTVMDITNKSLYEEMKKECAKKGVILA